MDKIPCDTLDLPLSIDSMYLNMKDKKPTRSNSIYSATWEQHPLPIGQQRMPLHPSEALNCTSEQVVFKDLVNAL